MSRYAKFLVALIPFVIAALKVVSDYVGTGAVSQEELIALVVTGVTALGVRQVPNTAPKGQAPRRDMSEQG